MSDGRTAALTSAAALTAEGRWLDAIDAVRAANNECRDPSLERRLVTLRRHAFPELVGRAEEFARTIPNGAVAPVAGDEVPEIDAADLDAGVVRASIEAFGCLLVRGLATEDRVSRFPEHIDQVLSVAGQKPSRRSSDELAAWYEPLADSIVGRRRRAKVREEQISKGAFLTADSPRVFAEVCELLDETGVGEIAAEYLGERPAFGYRKGVMRRMRGKDDWGWHQDGAFLGAEIRSLNMWMAFSDCGQDAPSLDVVPRRVTHIVEAGPNVDRFAHVLTPETVAEIAADTPVVRPTFKAGDALLFDHLLVHRAGGHAGMTTDRYSIECWFFAPTAYPKRGQVPLVF